MIIHLTKFHFSIGEYPGPHYSLNFKKGKFEYRCIPDFEPMTRMINPVVDENTDWDKIKVHLDSKSQDLDLPADKFVNFLKYVKRYCSHWKGKYKLGSEPVLDGTMWEVNIKTKDFSLKSEGHVSYPMNFDTFLLKLEQLTGKIFE